MAKRNIKTTSTTPSSFPAVKAYSVDEILAAGGTTAFAEKMGKNFNNIEETSSYTFQKVHGSLK